MAACRPRRRSQTTSQGRSHDGDQIAFAGRTCHKGGVPSARPHEHRWSWRVSTPCRSRKAMTLAREIVPTGVNRHGITTGLAGSVSVSRCRPRRVQFDGLQVVGSGSTVVPTLHPPTQRRHPRPAGLVRDVARRAGAVTARAALSTGRDPQHRRSHPPRQLRWSREVMGGNGDLRTQDHRGSNCLGGKKVELARQRRHDRDQSSHAQQADFGGQLVRASCTRRCSSSELAARARDSAP